MSVSPHENLWKDSRHTCRQGKQTADKKFHEFFHPVLVKNVGIIQFHGFFLSDQTLHFLFMNEFDFMILQ